LPRISSLQRISTWKYKPTPVKNCVPRDETGKECGDHGYKNFVGVSFFQLKLKKKNINLIRHFGMYMWLRLLFTFTEKPCLLGILISSNIKSLTLCGCDIMANFKLSNFSVSQIEKKFLKIALARNEILSVCFFFKDVKTIPPKLNSSRAPHNWNA